MARTIWIIIDAASNMVVDQLLEQGELPHFNRMIEQGCRSCVQLNRYNCQTPCALATQFSGIEPEENKVGGYFTPDFQKSGQGKLNYQITFKNQYVGENVLWNKKNIGTKQIALGQIPYSDSQQNNIKKIDGFSKMLYDAQVLYEDELNFSKHNGMVASNVIVFDRKFQIKLNNMNMQKEITLIELETDKRICVKCDENKNNDFWLEEATGFKFFAFTLDSGKLMFLFSNVYQYYTRNIDINHEFRDKVGTFFGVAYGKKYRNGNFGKPYYNGGNGNAERIFLHLLEEVYISFKQMNLFLLELGTELVISYQPVVDEMSHEFFGWWENSHGEAKEFYWNIVKKTYQMVDRHIAEVMECLDEQDNIIVTSDHGIYDINSIFYINEYLYLKGYLTYKNGNEIDVEESKAFYHPCNNGALFFNNEIESRNKILEELSNLVINGKKIVKETIDTCGIKVFGDCFIIPGKKIFIHAGRSQTIFESTNKSGCHTVNDGSESMYAIFLVKSKYLSELEICNNIKNTQIKEIVLKIINYSKEHFYD